MLRGLVTAFRTLTVLPVPGRDAERFSDSLHWFTLVGLLIGVTEASFAWIGSAAGWADLAALLPIAGEVVLTRGLHADGLADLADGFFGGRTREARLRIMKDPSVGSFGTLAVRLALRRLAGSALFSVIVSGALLSRMVQVLLASILPYARPEGGTATAFVDGAGSSHLVSSLLSGGVLVAALLHFEPVMSIALFVAALLSALAVGLLSRNRIGGVTGDVLGNARLDRRRLPCRPSLMLFFFLRRHLGCCRFGKMWAYAYNDTRAQGGIP